MKFNPMSEQDARIASAPPVLPNGDYDCQVTCAIEKNSASSGMGMFEIEIKVFTGDAKTRMVRDYVMTEGKAAWRLRECCEGLGILDRYDAGDVSEHDFADRTGRVRLSTEPATEAYPAKNRVKRYLAPTTHQNAPARQSARNTQRQTASAGGGDIDDDIPFACEWR